MPVKKSDGPKKSGQRAKREDKSDTSEKVKGSGPSPTKQSDDPAAQRFVRDLLIRGEAAEPDEKGELPPGATHRIVDEGEEGLPTVERDRFSLY